MCVSFVVTAMVAERAPGAVGMNETPNVVDKPALTLNGGAVAVLGKSAASPVTAMPVTVRVSVPVVFPMVNVTGLSPDVEPTLVVANARVAGVRVKTGAIVPVPVSDAVPVTDPSVTESVAEEPPVADGANVT